MEERQYKPAPRRRRGPGHGPGHGMMPGEKPKNFRKAIGDILRYMGSYKIAVFFVMIFAVFATIFEVVGPKVMGMATTELAEGLSRKISGTGGIEFDVIGKILVITLVLYTIGAVCQFFQGWIMTHVTQNLIYRMRGDIASKINRMPMKYF